ncbi:MAG: hypothetical protein ACOCUV_02165, partial [bacterium]
YSLFFLLSLIQYTKYVELKKGKYYIFSVLFFILSLFSKGQAVSLAISLVAIDLFLNRNIVSRKVILEKIPFLALAVVFGVIAIYAQQSMEAIHVARHPLY